MKPISMNTINGAKGQRNLRTGAFVLEDSTWFSHSVPVVSFFLRTVHCIVHGISRVHCMRSGGIVCNWIAGVSLFFRIYSMFVSSHR